MVKKKDQPVDLNVDTAGGDVSGKRYTPRTRGRPERDLYHMTFKMPRKTQKKLSTFAADQNTTLQDLVAQAVDEWMQARGVGDFDPDGYFMKK